MKRTLAIVLLAAIASLVSINLRGQQPTRASLASEIAALTSLSDHLEQALAEAGKHHRDAELAEQQIASIPDERVAVASKLFTEADPVKTAALRQRLEALTKTTNDLKASIGQSRNAAQAALTEAQSTSKRLRSKLDELKRLQ
jgi:hypothetical protein